jgi:hypothetical protein
METLPHDIPSKGLVVITGPAARPFARRLGALYEHHGQPCILAAPTAAAGVECAFQPKDWPLTLLPVPLDWSNRKTSIACDQADYVMQSNDGDLGFVTKGGASNCRPFALSELEQRHARH